MPEAAPVIILIVSTSFGEIDWILPALVAFKDKHPDWQLITLFGHAQVYERFVALNPELYREFRKVSSLNVVPQELPALFADTISPSQVRIILKDYNRDEFAPYKTTVADYCPKALVVSYPHSNHIYSVRKSDPLQHCPDPDFCSRHDIFLLGSENDIPFWSAEVDVNKIRTFGYPRYDSWWMERLLVSPDFLAAEESRRARAAGRVFFYISRGPHPHYLSPADYEYLVRSILEEVMRYDDALLLIKPHPRQDVGDLLKLLAPYDTKRWLLSGLHLLQLCSLAEVVISGWSSGILDALAVGKPVIEFWRFGGNDPLVRHTPDGRPTTIYRELGLAAAAETREELAALLASALTEPEASLWQGQRQAFRRHCQISDQAAQAVADCLVYEAERKQAPSPPAVTERAAPSELIATLIDYVADLVETNDQERARQWLDFLARQFPAEPRVFNNLGVLLFNQGEVTEAVDNLVKSLNLDPDYREGAVNLCQILLLLERIDDAVDLVVSFSLRAEEEGRRDFLTALRRELDDASFSLIQTRLAARQGG